MLINLRNSSKKIQKHGITVVHPLRLDFNLKYSALKIKKIKINFSLQFRGSDNKFSMKKSWYNYEELYKLKNKVSQFWWKIVRILFIN